MNRVRSWTLVGLAFAGLGLLTGCTATEQGALIGGAGGAGLGAIIGHQSGHAGEGALIGAAAGGIIGALSGNVVDEQNRRKEAEARLYGNKRVEYVQDGYRTEEVVEQVYVPPKYKYVEFVGRDDEGNEYRETKRVLVEEGRYEERVTTREVPVYKRVEVRGY